MGIKVVYYKVSGYTRLVDFACKKIQASALMVPGLQPNFAAPLPLPTVIKRWTVNKAAHVDKKSRETFERRTHYRLLSFQAESALIDKFTKYVFNCLPSDAHVKLIEHKFPSLDKFYTPPSKHMVLKLNENGELKTTLRDGSAAERRDVSPFPIPRRKKLEFLDDEHDFSLDRFELKGVAGTLLERLKSSGELDRQLAQEQEEALDEEEEMEEGEEEEEPEEVEEEEEEEGDGDIEEDPEDELS